MGEPHPAGVETDGVVAVGEVITRVQREALIEPDYHNAWVAGANAMLQEFSRQVQERYNNAGPYDDIRALADLRLWIADRIREVHRKQPLNGTP